MKVITVQVQKYQTEDGRIWDTESQAIHHEKILNGTRKRCPECDGTQQVPAVDFRSFECCPTCNGKGWVELVEVWK